MTSSRPVPWVSPVLYGAVLVAGLYAGAAGLGDTRLTIFLGGLAALFALEWPASLIHIQSDVINRPFDHVPRDVDHRTANGWAAGLLGVQAGLFGVVAFADGSGLSRVLFVLLPFTAYFAFGRAVSVALGFGCLGLLVASYQLTKPGWHSNVEYLTDLLMFGIGIVLVITMAAVAVEERKGRKRIAALSAEAERHRLARDIHDDLGHHLTAVVVLLEKAAAFRSRDPGVADRALVDAARSAKQALTDVRQSVRTLRTESGPFQLGTALRQLAGPDVSININGDPEGYPEAVLMVLYRAAQEGITNARRHAGATRISVSAELTEEHAQLTVHDDGHGLGESLEGFGLTSMRERVTAAGGRLEVKGAAVSGTQLKVWIPK